jgi:hypothetical protein
VHTDIKQFIQREGATTDELGPEEFVKLNYQDIDRINKPIYENQRRFNQSNKIESDEGMGELLKKE